MTMRTANTIHHDNHQGYLKALGMARTAQVKRDARIGEAEARRDATIKVIARQIEQGFIVAVMLPVMSKGLAVV